MLNTTTFTERYNKAKRNIIIQIISRVTKRKNGILVLPSLIEVEYSSMDNGWCLDYLGAIAQDGTAYFVMEGTKLPSHYDFEEDENDIVVAYMSLEDIFLSGLVKIAKALRFSLTDTAEKLLAHVDERFANMTESVTVSVKDVNYVNQDYFWKTIDVEAVDKTGIDTIAGRIPLDCIPVDDKCMILDTVDKKALYIVKMRL